MCVGDSNRGFSVAGRKLNVALDDVVTTVHAIAQGDAVIKQGPPTGGEDRRVAYSAYIWKHLRFWYFITENRTGEIPPTYRRWRI